MAPLADLVIVKNNICGNLLVHNMLNRSFTTKEGQNGFLPKNLCDVICFQRKPKLKIATNTSPKHPSYIKAVVKMFQAIR